MSVTKATLPQSALASSTGPTVRPTHSPLLLGTSRSGMTPSPNSECTFKDEDKPHEFQGWTMLGRLISSLEWVKRLSMHAAIACLGEEEEGEAEHCLCLWRDRGVGTGMGEEGAGSTVDARQRDAWSLPSKTADMTHDTHDFPADPMLNRIYLLCQLRTRMWSQVGNTQPGS